MGWRRVRQTGRTDQNQEDIVKKLIMAGISVEVGHDDVLCGYNGRTFWFEIKRPEQANKKGMVFNSSKKDKQKRLEQKWKGHYKIVTTLQEILDEIMKTVVAS